jgi:nicotinamide-nucleotide amidase
LQERNLKLSAAESCTGGYLSHLFTSIAGSSNYFEGSIIAYNNTVKQNILGVKEKTLAIFGAVSEETVKEMAEGARKALGTDIAISTSGIAGPTGGTDEKPVGTIWIGYSDIHTTIAKKLILGNNREINIKMTSLAVLNLIRQTLLKKS